MSAVKKVRIVDPKDESPNSAAPVETVKNDEEDNEEIDLDTLVEYLVSDIIEAAYRCLLGIKKAPRDITWITHGNFTAERGRNQIQEFVSSWEFEDRWVHWTEYLKREDWIHSFYYRYAVHFSVPTAQRPIPRVSASIDFTIKINKNKPPDAPIDISYILDQQVLVLRPGMLRFRERWLREIIEIKYIILETPEFKEILSLSPTYPELKRAAEWVRGAPPLSTKSVAKK